MTQATEFPPFPLGCNSTTSLICNKIFLMPKVNYSLVLISFYYSWCTLNNSPFFPFPSSELLSLSQLHSQLQVQKLNVFRYCKSSFKSEETAVTCRYSQYFNLSLSGIRWCSGPRGIFQTEKKSQTYTFLNYVHSRWHTLPLVYLLLFKFIFSCMPMCCQLSVLKSQH